MTDQLPMLEKEHLTLVYTKYADELRPLSVIMRTLYQRMQREGFGTTFGDVEGELLYLVIRELKPSVCFEISPNAGWSTNYILAALKANGRGKLHSFEIQRRLKGKSIEEVISRNLLDSSFCDSLILHIGDARDTIKSVSGTIDLLLLDSCHDEMFARWYCHTVFPRLSGVAMIHDVAFVDQLEKSTESRYIWNWLREEGVPFQLVGDLERDLSPVRQKLEIVERRPYRCNSVIFSWPIAFRCNSAWRDLPALDYSERIAQSLTNLNAKEAECALRDARFNLVKNEIHVVNRHRELFRLAKLFDENGSKIEARETNRIALEMALQFDSLKRKSALIELFYNFVGAGYIILAIQTLLKILIEPASVFGLFRHGAMLLISRRS